MLDEVLAFSQAQSLPLAILYLALGHPDQALHWLGKAIDSREPYIVMIPTDIRFAPVRADPRFRALMRRMGLAKVATS